MRNVSAATYYNLYGGRDDKSDSIEMPETKFQEIINMRVERDSLIKREGYAKRFVSALESGAAMQRVHDYFDNTQSHRTINAINGKLYRDANAGAAPTDITGSLTLNSSQDAIFQFINYDGRVVGTDGTNPLFVIPSISSDGELLNAGPTGAQPSVARALGQYYAYILTGDITERADGVRYPFRVRWHSPPFINDWPDDRFTDLNRSQRVIGFRQHGNSMLIFQDQSIWVANLSSSVANIQGVQTEFDFMPLDHRVGAVSDKAIVQTEKGLFWLDRKGVFFMPPGQVQMPVYVGKPTETLWQSVNTSRLAYAAGGDVREKNGVLFSIPYGTTQTTNNYGIFLNYEEWSRYGRASHPAFSIFTGSSVQVFAFNCFGSIVVNNKDYLVGGSYSGFAYDMLTGTTDNGNGIQARIITPFYAPQGRARESIWYQLALDIDLESTKTITLSYSLYNDPTPITRTLQTTNASTPLGTFVLGQSVLGRDDVGRLIADLSGRSRYIEIDIIIDSSQETFNLHGIVLYFKPVNMYP